MKSTKKSEADYHPAFLTGRYGWQWWIISAAIILGGLIGLGLSQVFRPVYEARFGVVTSVNLAANPNVNELLLDQVLMHVGGLASSQGVFEQVISAEKQKGINIDAASLLRFSTVERKLTTTYIKVQWSDAETAAQIANTWGNLFYADLQEGARQALIADELSKTLTTLQGCLAGTDATSTSPLCGFNKTDLESQIVKTTNDLASAQALSLGLYPGINVDAFEEAIVPGAPVRNERGWLIGAGAAIGFILALLLTEVIYSPAKKSTPE